MGRSISGGGGSASSGAGIQSAGTVVTAGEAVQAGDLLSLGADNLAYYGLEPNSIGASLRPITNPSPVTNGLQIPLVTASTQVPTSVGAFSADKLANGNIVVAWRTDPNMYYAIYKPDGTPVLGAALIESGGTPTINRPVKVKALAAGGFALGWCNLNGAIYTPRFALYDAAGTLQGAILNVENPATSFATTAIDIQQLASGNIIYAYGAHNGTNYQPRFSIYNAAGAPQVSNVQVDTTMTAAITLPSTALGVLGITVLTGGTFVYAYGLYDGTNTSTFSRRYDAAGAALAARTSHSGTTSQGNGAPLALCSTTDGGFVVSASNNIKKYDASGNVIGGGNVGLTWGHTLTPLAGGGYRVVVCAANLNIWIFNAAGVQVGTTLAIDTGTTTSNYVTESVLNDGSILYSYAKGSNAAFTRVDANLNVIGSPGIVVAAAMGLPPVFGFGTTNPSSAIPTFAVVLYGASGVILGIYNTYVQKLTLIGVATASAAQGSAVPVQYLGVVTLRVGFKQPYAVNYQASTPPGQKMSILGNSALMSGVQ
jgi:hypothetical protein